MNPHSDSKISTSFFIQSIATVHWDGCNVIRCYFRSIGEVTTNCHAYMISVHAQYIYEDSKLLTLFLPGEGGISPLIDSHVTKLVRDRVNMSTI